MKKNLDSSVISKEIFEYLSKSENDRVAKSSPYFEDSIEDPRKIGLKSGLRQLTIEQLQRVIDYPDDMILDQYNYQDGKFCPLAVGLELDKIIPEPTHDKIFNHLTKLGYQVYNTRGIKGEFYTTNRKEDLIIAAKEVLEEKRQNISVV